MARYPALDLYYTPAPTSDALQELLHVALDDFEPFAIVEHDAGDGWRVFFQNAERRDAAVAFLQTRFGGQLTGIASIDVPDEAWAQRSQEQLRAVTVGDIVVAPPWDVPSAQGRDLAAAPARVVIVIDPSMGFGTGHHETTRLCLRLLQQADVKSRRVVDVGTGSGVLALAAWKLGADDITAIDRDADALRNARDNIARNGASAAIELRHADLGNVSLAPADIVLANLTGAALCRHAPDLRALTKPSGALIASGFSASEADTVTSALGGAVRLQVTENDWTALLIDR